MSYILEALTESERARLQVAAVPKYSLLPVLSEDAQQQRRWPYALAGALLVNAAVLPLWLRPAPPGGVPSIEMPTAPQLAQTPADALPRAASVNPAYDGAAIQRRPKIAPNSIAQRNAEAAAATEADSAQTPTIAKRNAEAAVAIEANAAQAPTIAKRSAGADVATKANPDRTPSPNPTSPSAETAKQAGGATELPPKLQQELPALSVAGFIRDEDSSSMVIVNDRLLREGDEVAPGVRLEKILNDGLELTYKGYRFKR